MRHINKIAHHSLTIGALIIILQPFPVLPQTITFDDSDQDLIRLGNPYYEIGILKRDNSFSYIYEKAALDTFRLDPDYTVLWAVSGLGPSAPAFDTPMNSKSF